LSSFDEKLKPSENERLKKKLTEEDDSHDFFDSIKVSKELGKRLILTETKLVEIFDSFYSVTANTIDKHAPLKKSCKKEAKFQSKPWISQGIRKSIKIKNKLFNFYLRNKFQSNHSKYKICRNKLKHISNVSKRFIIMISTSHTMSIM